MTVHQSPAQRAPEGGTLRLFVACGLADSLRQALASRCAALRARLPSARWVPAENLHLTLCFLGATPATAVPALDAALQPVFAAAPPGRLVLTGGGTFPPGRRARVAWVAVNADGDSGGAGPDFGALAAAVCRAVRSALPSGELPAGDATAERAFTPHLTLARPQPPWSPRASQAFTNAWSDLPSADLGCVVTEGVLMASELGNGPPRYRAVSRYPLLGAGPQDERPS